MPKKIVKTSYDNIVVGSDIKALLYSFTRNMTCFYVAQEKIEPVVQPTNQFILNNFCSDESIGNENKQEKFLEADKLEFFLRFILNLDGKLYQINRNNLRFTDGNLVHKTNKTEMVLQANTIHLFDNVNDPFLDFVCIDGKILKTRFYLDDDKEINNFDNSSVTVRYLLDEFLTGNKEIILTRDYYRSLKPKLENRIIVPDYRYNTEEDNIKVVKESLEKLCQQPILPPQESYLYYLTKRILDLIGTIA